MVGFAALIILSAAAIKLPGRAITAAVLVCLLLLVSVAVLVLRKAWPWSGREIAAGIVSLLGASIPFVANGRVGLPGVSLDDDTSTFLLYTEALRSARVEALWSPGNGYPLGPSSLTAVLSSGTGMGLGMAYCGLFLAIVAITAMTACAILRARGAWRGVVLGVLSSLAYLAAAYYAEGSFKETVMGLLLLGGVVLIDQTRVIPRGQPISSYARTLIPPLLVVVAAIYTYSYVAVVWFAATVIFWLAGEALTGPKRLLALRDWVDTDRLLAVGAWILGGLLGVVILLAPIAAQIFSFFSKVGVSAGGSAIPAGALGNLVHPLSGYEALGLWWSNDFRVNPPNAFHAGELAAFALVVLAFALVWSIRRRELLLPAAVLACLLIWWRSDGATHPYVAAKALVIAAPLVVALDLRALLGFDLGDRLGRSVALVVAAAFCVAAGYSSYSVLRSEPVAAPAEGRELAAFSQRIGDARVLYLGSSAYAPWQLRGASVSAVDPNVLTQGLATLRANVNGVGPLGFASVDPSDLNRFSYVITSNTAYASPPPPNFHLVDSRRLYQLWQRRGPTPERETLNGSTPGTVLSCRNPALRKLAHGGGVAGVAPVPVVTTGISLPPGGSASVSLPLPAGRWEISIQYTSSFDLQLSAQGQRWTMPARLGIPAQFFTVGQVIGHGAKSPVVLSASLPRPSVMTLPTFDYMTFPSIAATRVGAVTRMMPLRRACGRYVEWFQPR